MPETQRFDNLRKRWEERASTYQSAPVGVLYRGLSPAMNDYVHRFHLNCLSTELLERLPKGARLLDLGCGYGRIGMAVRAQRPDIEIVGCDVALAYCRLYRVNLATETVCGDLETLPFQAGTFDAVLAVTTLMYLPPARREAVVRVVLELLRSGGLAMFIEPAQEVLALMARLRPGAARETTGGSGYRRSELVAITRMAGCARLSSGGMPVFTLALPVLVMLDRWPALQRPLLAVLRQLDRRMAAFAGFSLQRWLLVRCPSRAVEDD
jgi:SAM-dependent methyltransferase